MINAYTHITTITVSTQNMSITPKYSLMTPCSHCPISNPSLTHPLLSLQVRIIIFRISYKRGHTVWTLLWFLFQLTFDNHPCCCIYQQSVPFVPKYLSTQFLMNENLGCFPFLAITNKAPKNTCAWVFCVWSVFISLG